MDAINACRWCCKAVAYAASYVSLEAGLVAFIFVGLIPQMTHAGVQVGNRISKSSNILETAFLFWFVFWVVSCLKTRIWFFCMLFFPRKCHFKCISDGSTQVLFLGTVFVGRSSRCLIDAAAQLHHIHQLLPLLAHAQLFVADVQQKSCIFSVNFAFFFHKQYATPSLIIVGYWFYCESEDLSAAQVEWSVCEASQDDLIVMSLKPWVLFTMKVESRIVKMSGLLCCLPRGGKSVC